MATKDDTANPTRGRRNQPNRAVDTPTALTALDAAPLRGETLGKRPPPPTTLEAAIEAVRTQLLEGRAMLRCLSEVLLYADDADSVMHADVAQAIGKWINDAAEQLDLTKLQPLIDVFRQRDGGASGNEAAAGYPGDPPPYQGVREPMAVYCV